MFKCPNRTSQKDYDDCDDYLKGFFWHEKNCTCLMIELYHFKMIEQDDHIRAYWEAEGKQRVRWDHRFGMLLEYPISLHDMMKIRYPYH